MTVTVAVTAMQLQPCHAVPYLADCASDACGKGVVCMYMYEDPDIALHNDSESQITGLPTHFLLHHRHQLQLGSQIIKEITA